MAHEFIKDLIKSSQEANQSKKDEEESKLLVANMIGLTMANMDDVVRDDIYNFITNGRRETLDGYVFCLSRLMSHEVAWRAIGTAFKKSGEKVPSKYEKMFSPQARRTASPPESNLNVS